MKVYLGTTSDGLTSEVAADERALVPESTEVGALAKLRPVHREAIRRLVSGQTVSAVAHDTGLSRSYLSNLKNQDPLFKAELDTAMLNKDADVLKRIQLTSFEALDVVKDLMRKGKSENIRLQAAMTILDRAGYSKLEKRLTVIADAETVIRELNKLDPYRTKAGDGAVDVTEVVAGA